MEEIIEMERDKKEEEKGKERLWKRTWPVGETGEEGMKKGGLGWGKSRGKGIKKEGEREAWKERRGKREKLWKRSARSGREREKG